MNRRKLLTFIGLAPLAPIAAWAKPIDDRWYPKPGLVPFGPFVPDKSDYIDTLAADGPRRYRWVENDTRLVCENHHDKAWPDECDCGPGMRYGDTLRS